jgi:hypothetical protein
MIVRDLHVVGIVPAPREADPVLVVDPDAVLPEAKSEVRSQIAEVRLGLPDFTSSI